eukprot:m.339891 g.339891  ORF g.339891 m.339891 type:complete len:290 (+) comp55754_c0_seq8:427-1296(+)
MTFCVWICASDCQDVRASSVLRMATRSLGSMASPFHGRVFASFSSAFFSLSTCLRACRTLVSVCLVVICLLFHHLSIHCRLIRDTTVANLGDQTYMGNDHAPCVYIMNHQGILDAVISSVAFPNNTVVVAKKTFLYVPFFGQVFWALGNIAINRSDRDGSVNAMRGAAERVKKEGLSVFIFPEGTRNRQGELLPFKKGAFHLAIQAQVPIVPLVCSEYIGLGGFYSSKEKRWQPHGKVSVTTLPALSTKGMKEEDAAVLAEKARTVMHAEIERQRAEIRARLASDKKSD